MVFEPKRTAVVGATGPTGIHLARELMQRGRRVRVVSRSRERLEASFSGLEVEIAPADALDVGSLEAAVADLAERDEAYGADWALAGAGTLSPARLAEIASKHLGRRVRVQAAQPWLLRLVGLFSSEVRGILPMVGHYAKPVRYDAVKLRKLLGPPQPTPFEVSIPATLDWLRQPR